MPIKSALVNIKTLTITLSAFLLISCEQESELTRFGSIDISGNDSMIVFSYFKNNVGYLYTSTIGIKNIKDVAKSNDTISVNSPVFSNNGKMILYVGFSKTSTKSNLFVTDNNGFNRRQVTFQNKLITRAIFSGDDKGVFYVKAEVYKNYSTVGRPAPHVMDIFYLDLKTLKEVRVTNLKAYEISGISSFGEEALIFKLVKSNKEMGLYSLHLGKSKRIAEVNPLNSPRFDSGLYSNPSFSDKFDIIAFTAPDEIYIMNAKLRKAALIFRSTTGNNIWNLRAFHNDKKLMFLEGKILKIISHEGVIINESAININ